MVGVEVLLPNLDGPLHQPPRLESAGALVLRLPPHSPDFKPIEMTISKLKSLLRKLGHDSMADLETAITAKDARGFFAHCGYPATNA
jgi:transposase